MSTKPLHRIEVYEGPNKYGEYHYAVFWMANYPPNTRLEKDFDGSWHERGQHFFCVPPKHHISLPGGRKCPGNAKS